MCCCTELSVVEVQQREFSPAPDSSNKRGPLDGQSGQYCITGKLTGARLQQAASSPSSALPCSQPQVCPCQQRLFTSRRWAMRNQCYIGVIMRRANTFIGDSGMCHQPRPRAVEMLVKSGSTGYLTCCRSHLLHCPMRERPPSPGKSIPIGRY